ncbi:hypothetical protein [Streptomyces olivaceus]|uniref:hypothetical protein n=1 Tax=Streptomyces olivaceus TaxID=47716 RepID=UPI004055B8E6
MDRRAWKHHAAQAHDAGSAADNARAVAQRLRHKDDQPAPSRPEAATAGGGA